MATMFQIARRVVAALPQFKAKDVIHDLLDKCEDETEGHSNKQRIYITSLETRTYALEDQLKALQNQQKMVQTYQVSVPPTALREWKIASIKLLRFTSPIGLKDAKDKVEDCIALNKPLTFEGCAEDLMKAYLSLGVPSVLTASVVTQVGMLPATL